MFKFLILLKKKINIFRTFKFYRNKIVRIRDLPESVAIGLAWGASVSFTPLLGLHIIICFLGTLIMRGNLLAAAAGTIVGNPWTFPFIFYLDYSLGNVFFRNNIDEVELNLTFFYNNFQDFFFPTLLGSLPISILIWFITYNISCYFLVRKKRK